MEFEKYPKIVRRKGLHMVITEKIDGTNAQINIPDDPSAPFLVGSRNRVIAPDGNGQKTDNYGFARWVADNEVMLRRLGPGRHYGEWWGQGIGRGYGINEKRLSLFDTHRFRGGLPEGVPVGIVPILYSGQYDIGALEECLERLSQTGSVAVPGWMKPEGVVVWVNGQLWKEILDKDGPSPEET